MQIQVKDVSLNIAFVKSRLDYLPHKSKFPRYGEYAECDPLLKFSYLRFWG